MNAQKRFCLIPRMVIFESLIALTSFDISPWRRVMPADAIATSVPVAIAIPISACASAGASLTPSPAIATMFPCD